MSTWNEPERVPPPTLLERFGRFLEHERRLHRGPMKKLTIERVEGEYDARTGKAHDTWRVTLDAGCDAITVERGSASAALYAALETEVAQ